MSISERIDKICLTIKKNFDREVEKPSLEDIQGAEEMLALKFPLSYKTFLLEVGYSDWPDYIRGLGNNILPGKNVLVMTLRERVEAIPPLNKALVAFASDGWGNQYCLNTALTVEDECPVVLWKHELHEDQPLEVTHDSFVDWLEEQCQLVHDEEP